MKNRSVGADVIVEVDGRAVVEAVRARGAHQHVVVGKVNLQRRAPGIHKFPLLVQLGLAADENDDVFRIVADERLDDLGVAADGIGSDVVLVLLKAGKEVATSSLSLAVRALALTVV